MEQKPMNNEEQSALIQQEEPQTLLENFMIDNNFLKKCELHILYESLHCLFSAKYLPHVLLFTP